MAIAGKSGFPADMVWWFISIMASTVVFSKGKFSVNPTKPPIGKLWRKR
jgi:hypothetical protein